MFLNVLQQSEKIHVKWLNKNNICKPAQNWRITTTKSIWLMGAAFRQDRQCHWLSEQHFANDPITAIVLTFTTRASVQAELLQDYWIPAVQHKQSHLLCNPLLASCFHAGFPLICNSRHFPTNKCDIPWPLTSKSCDKTVISSPLQRL